MADDQQNPFTLAGMMQMMQPNKYVDPKYKNKSLDLQGFYGAPTDAMGNPIQSFDDAQKAHDAWDTAHPAQPQGTTLNSPGTVSPGAGYFQGQAGSQALGAQLAPKGSLPGIQALWGRNFAGGAPSAGSPLASGSVYGAALGATGQGTGGQSATTASAPETNPIDMRQAYLDALAKPQGDNRMPTPGATIPASKPLGQPSVMDAFMAQHPSGGTAAPAGGGYSNKPFFDTLAQLRSA